SRGLALRGSARRPRARRESFQVTSPERIWYEDAPSARVARALLTPFELAYRATTEIRNRLYDSRWLTVYAPPIPAISVGNLTVGGTGKTPVAAYFVGRFI